MDDTDYFLRFVHYHDRCNFFLFHGVESFAREHVRADGLRILGHSAGGGQGESCSSLLFHQAAEVAVGDDAGEFSIGLKHGGHTEFLRAHFVKDVGHFCFQRDARKSVGGVHQVLDAEKFFAEAAGGVKRGEVVVAEIATFKKRDGKCVADGHCDGSARGWREIQGTGFFFHADVESDVAGFGESGFEIAGQSDERNFEALERFEEMNDFFGLAAVRDGDERVAAREHAEVAVERFGGMKKERWSAGAGERCRNFSRDEAGLAHAGENDAAFAGEEEVDGFFEGGVEARENVLNGLRFDFKNSTRCVEAHTNVIPGA